MDQGEAKRRLTAARILRDMTQEEMSRRGHEMGLDKQELGRAERGTIPFTEARQMVACKVLDAPATWFTEPDVDRLLWPPATAEGGLSRERLAMLDQALPQLAEDVRALLQEPEGIASAQVGSGRPRTPGGGGA